MKQLAYGVNKVQIPDDATVGYGARAIFKNSFVDYVWDRIDAQVWSQDEEHKLQMGSWMRRTGMPWIEKMAKSLYQNENKLMTLDDGIFHARINPQASYGYLYITMWRDADSV